MMPRRKRSSLLGAACLCALSSAGAADECAATSAIGFADPAKRVEVAAREPGIIARQHVDVGARVTKGDLLAELDKRLGAADVALARARAEAEGRIAAAEARRDQTRRRAEELKRLSRSGAARPFEVAEAGAQLTIAEAELQTVLDERRVARLELESAEVRLALLDVRAPFDGVVEDILRRESELAGAGGDARILTLVETDSLHVEIFAPAACLDDIAIGDVLTVAAVRSGADFSARVRELGGEIDAATGLRGVVLEIRNEKTGLLVGERISLALPPDPRPGER
ncbi:efflux RND transporter periplasmic adaptor subunit [Pikeienuella piscinae]|uniref:Efflux RND transporter periplasmic adaptor subunit n=1 Tax=Pikeienuella piscinae TaxID=2748098 RepID=A0A7L5C0K3_9RHOB|nr:efflux RND transporter periplasmic adaptor subunit [Pikeienuella piscinae]QIE56046.1 efflux RND transporter periplasmic adaptor subunit [Pikeienuella piscinae]